MLKTTIMSLIPATALAANLSLPTPATVPLSHPPNVYCYAAYATVEGYQGSVTGFSADGNYILGQAPSYYTCGHSGRGSTVHTVYLCTFFTWDLSGNLVSENTPFSAVSVQCPAVSLVMPPTTPPATSVVGNEFTNAGGYVAETIVTEECGSIACYGDYFTPTLITP